MFHLFEMKHQFNTRIFIVKPYFYKIFKNLSLRIILLGATEHPKINLKKP